MDYTYDDFGRVTLVTQGGNQHAYSYDSELLLDTETVTYDLDDDGTAELTRVLDRSFDSLRRADGWELKDGSTVEHASSYGYDVAGRLKSVDPSFPLPANPAFTYGYVDDSLGLVKTVTGPAHTCLLYTSPSPRDS